MSLSFKENYVSHKKFQFDFSLSSNPFGPSAKVNEILIEKISHEHVLAPYPDASYSQLTHSIASFYKILPEEIFLGAGLDGLITDIINLLLHPGDELVLPAVTFRNAMYTANNNGASITQVPMQPNLAVDFDALIQAIHAKTKVIFLCNPNNPTGIYEPLESIRRLLKSTQALVILDEANIEFSGESGMHLVNEFPHLVVLRTFSKAYGLAGIRVGYGVSKSPLLKKIPASRPPFFISTLSELAACTALSDQTYLKQSVESIIHERIFLEIELEKLGFNIFPSQSNTLFCRIPQNISSASHLIEKLHQYDCHLVNGTYFNLEDCYLRIAPRLHESNEQLIRILKYIL